MDPESFGKKSRFGPVENHTSFRRRWVGDHFSRSMHMRNSISWRRSLPHFQQTPNIHLTVEQLPFKPSALQSVMQQQRVQRRFDEMTG